MINKYLFKINCEQCDTTYLDVGYADELSAGCEKTICPSCKNEKYIIDKPVGKIEEIE
ncbi:MAG: hypothetical protein ACOCZ5_00600 [bacterium]